MKKKSSPLKLIIYIIALGVFFFFENQLYQKYKSEKEIRDFIKERNTTEVESVFLTRKKYFYSDKEYLKKFKKLTQESLKKEEEQSVK